jgi:hypothetical protein
MSPQTGAGLEGDDYEFYVLATKLQTSAGEPIGALNHLRVDPRTKNQGWKCLKVARMAVWDKKKLLQMETTLEGYRRALNMKLVLAPQYDQSLICDRSSLY